MNRQSSSRTRTRIDEQTTLPANVDSVNPRIPNRRLLAGAAAGLLIWLVLLTLIALRVL